MGVKPGLLRLGHVLGLRVAGYGNERNAREAGVGAKRSCDVEAAYSGQPEVAEDDVRLGCPSLLDPMGSAVGDIDDVMIDLYRGTQAIGRVEFACSDEH